MKKLILILLIFSIIPPVYAVKIKIKSAYKIGIAQEAVAKLNQKAMKEQNVFVVPRGRRIYSRLNDNIYCSNLNISYNTKKGDVITTQLMQDWQYKNNIVAPEGSLVRGTIIDTSSKNLTKISFDKIVRPDNVEINIITKPIIITTDNLSDNTPIPLGTEFTIQIINDIITSPY